MPGLPNSAPRDADWYVPNQPADPAERPEISFWAGMQGIVDGTVDGYIVRGGPNGSVPISTSFVEVGSPPPVIEMHPAWASYEPFFDGKVSQEEAAERLATGPDSLLDESQEG